MTSFAQTVSLSSGVLKEAREARPRAQVARQHQRATCRRDGPSAEADLDLRQGAQDRRVGVAQRRHAERQPGSEGALLAGQENPRWSEVLDEKACDDDTPCTADACDVESGCEHSSVLYELPCYSAPSSREKSTCISGVRKCNSGVLLDTWENEVVPNKYEACDDGAPAVGTSTGGKHVVRLGWLLRLLPIK